MKTGKGYNKSLDIWSIGIIHYVSLTGKFPYDENNDLVEQQKRGIIEFPKQNWGREKKNVVKYIKLFLHVSTLFDDNQPVYNVHYQCHCTLFIFS